MARLKAQYETEIKKKMMDKYKYGNVHQIPKLEKIIVNSVTRDAVSNGKIVDSIAAELAAVTGQKPVTAKAKMYEFLDRLINLSLPRVKDFRGLSPKGFDGKGNYTMGLKEQIIFPEIDYDKIDKIRGMGISFVTTATNNEEGRELLRQFGMPFREK